MKVENRIPQVLAVTAALIGISVLSSIPAAAQDSWKIPVVVAATGPMASFSAELKLGLQIALDEVNKKGGVKGKKVVLDILDTQSDPGQVASLTRQACSNYLFMIGPAYSNEARVGFPIANGMKCLAMTANAAATGLTANNRPWSFAYTMASNRMAGPPIEALVARLKPARAVVVIEKADPAAVETGNIAIDVMKKNSIQVQDYSVAGSDVDFGPIVTRISGSNPDLIVLATYDRAGIGMLKELNKAGSEASVVLGQTTYNALVDQLSPEVLKHAYRYAESDPATSPDPRVKDFTTVYTGLSGGRNPSLTAFLGYDVLGLVTALIAETDIKGDPASVAADREKLRAAFEGIKDFPGLTGKASMTPEGFLMKSPVLLKSMSGKWERVPVN